MAYSPTPPRSNLGATLKSPLRLLKRRNRAAFDGRSSSERSPNGEVVRKPLYGGPWIGYSVRARTAKKEILDKSLRWPRGSWGAPRSIPVCVRGNLFVGVNGQSYYGSIPACAGEPPSRSGSTVKGRVYPRMCGGTSPTGGHPPWRGSLRRNPGNQGAPIYPGRTVP